MGESPKIIDIQELSLLKITKVKPWAIYFDYDQKHYLLHGKSDGYESVQELYERHLDKNGFWTLEFIKSDYGNEYIINYYIKPISWQTIVYNQIDKEYFVRHMAIHGFIKSDKIINNPRINTVQDLISQLQKFPSDMEVRDYNFMEIEDVKIKTWHHDNYPYDKPEKDYVCIC